MFHLKHVLLKDELQKHCMVHQSDVLIRAATKPWYYYHYHYYHYYYYCYCHHHHHYCYYYYYIMVIIIIIIINSSTFSLQNLYVTRILDELYLS